LPCGENAIADFVSRLENPHATNFVAIHEGLSRSEIEPELRLVLDGPEFRKNSNSAKFLKFVVEETLDGRGARLKAYAIATLALERAASFDPQADSIVRVQAMRLRDLLEAYYAGAGANDPVQIVLRRGTYQPCFERRVPREDPVTQIAVVGPRLEETSPPPFSNWMRALIAIGAAVVLATALIASKGWTSLGRGPGSVWPPAAAGSLDGPPSIIVETPETGGASPRTARLSSRLFSSIEEGFGNFEYIALRSSSFRSSRDIGNGYVLHGQIQDSGNGRYDVAFRLVREPTDDVIWSRHYDDVNADDRSAVDKLANSIVADLGDPNGGVVFADIRDRLRSANVALRGYACLIGGVEFLRNRAKERRAVERNCLETEVEANAQHVGALTLLATMLILGYIEIAPENRGIADLRRASQLARLANDLAPHRAASFDVLFLECFYNKNFDAAFRAAREALVANPNGALLAERIAAAYISRGSYAEGLALLGPLEATSSGPPIGSIPFLALAAHMRGDASATLDYAQRIGATATPLGLVMRIVAFRERGDESGVAAASAQLRADFPGFAEDIPAALDRYAMVDSIRTTLLQDLAAAGYAPTKPDR
jgi:adenylate cyclase